MRTVCLTTAVFAVWSGLSIPASAIDSAAAHIGKGYELVQQQRWAGAASEFRSAIAIDPTLVRARYELGVCLFALGERDASEQEFRKLQEMHADLPNVLYYRGRLRLLAGDNDGAIDFLRKLSPAESLPDAQFYLGCAYLNRGDVAPAISALTEAEQNAPRDYRIPYRLARAYMKAGRKSEAELQFQRSSSLRNSYDTAAQEASQCNNALTSRSIDDARSICERMADPNDPDKLTTLGILYGQHGAYRDAVRALERAGKLDTDSFEIFHNIGLSYFRLQEYANARSALERAVALRPDFYGSNALLGAVLFTLKEDELSFSILNRANQLHPDKADAADLLFRVSMALAREKFLSKDYKTCVEYLQTAQRVKPEQISVRRKLAEVYRLLGETTASEEETREADVLERTPHSKP